jgi:hypothetical protein
MRARFGIAFLVAALAQISPSFAGDWFDYYPEEFAWQAAPQVVEEAATYALGTPSYVTTPYTLYQGVQGWQQVGWETGRWIET